ncbi:MAG: hypothetical protein RLP44_20855 [Aggregatilineales bacterium]
MKWLGSLLLTLIILTTAPPAQAHHADFVKIATLWNVHGQIESISPDGRFLIMRYNDNVSLVDSLSGEIILDERGLMRFSPSGRYVSYYGGGSGFTLFDTNTTTFHEFSGDTPYFSLDEQFFATEVAHEGETFTRVWSTDYEIIGEYQGHFDEFSPNSRLMVLYDDYPVEDSYQYLTQVIDLETSTIVAEITAMTTLCTNARFSPDGSRLAIYYCDPHISRVYDTTSWEFVFEARGFPGFSPEGNYFIARGEELCNAKSELRATSTGEIIDVITGCFIFESVTDQYVSRIEQLNPNFLTRTQVVDLDVNGVIFEAVGIHLINVLIINILDKIGLIQYQWSNTLFDGMHHTEFIDIETGETVLSLNESADYQHGNLVVDEFRRPIQRLVDWETLDTLAVARGRNMQFSPDGKFVFIPNGLFVDVYAHPSLQSDAMPPPSPDSGIGYVEAGTFAVYTRPLGERIHEEQTPNATYMNVLGRHAERDYLYVTFNGITGWIPANQVREYANWRNAPVLSEENPLGDLQRIATETATRAP